VFSALSAPRLYSYNTSPLAVKESPVEFLLEFIGSRVTEQGMARILHSYLKC
jgi:hypothetical protein